MGSDFIRLLAALVSVSIWFAGADKAGTLIIVVGLTLILAELMDIRQALKGKNGAR